MVLDNYEDISMREARDKFEKKFLEKSLKNMILILIKLLM